MRLIVSAVLLLAIGCAPEPEDPIYMHATAFGSDGAPLANSLLLLERSKTYRWDDLEPFAELTTDETGAFGYEFEHRHLSRGDGSWHSFRVRRPSGQGAGTILDFDYYGRADFRLPPFRDVEVGTQLDGSTLSFVPPAVDDDEERLDLVELHAGDDIAWSEIAATQTLTFDPVHLEDFGPARVRVRSTASGELVFKSLLLDHWSSVSYMRSVYSPDHELSLQPIVPLSRGASCSFPLKEDGPCPLTDGKLEKVDIDDYTRAGVQEIRIDLGEPRRVQRLVLRGVESDRGMLIARTSADGTRWRDAARFELRGTTRYYGPAGSVLTEAFLVVPLTPGEEVRHLRLVPEDAQYGLPSFARELSLLE